MDAKMRDQITELGNRCLKAIESGTFTPDHSTIFIMTLYCQNLEQIVTTLSKKVSEAVSAQEVCFAKTICKTDQYKLVNAMLAEELNKGLI